MEERLTQMTKPEVTRLKHQDMLAEAIAKAKDKSVLSWWWLVVPLYTIAALLMKTAFMPHTTFFSNFSEMESKQKYTSMLFFLVMPLAIMLINLLSIRKLCSVFGYNSSSLYKLWPNVLMILLSVLVFLIYSL